MAASVRRLALAVVVLAVATLVYWFNPAATNWFPQCPLHALTGWHCPGCGATRACHALLHGDLAKAWACNPLLVVGVPAGMAFGIWNRARFGPNRQPRIWQGWFVLTVVFVVMFAVLRNVPVYPLDLLAPH